MREDTAPENSGDRVLCSNRWTVRGTLLQTILDNWAVFQGLWDDILYGKVDSEIWGKVMHESDTSQHESDTSQNDFGMNQHKSKTGLDQILLKIHDLLDHKTLHFYEGIYFIKHSLLYI